MQIGYSTKASLRTSEVLSQHIFYGRIKLKNSEFYHLSCVLAFIYAFIQQVFIEQWLLHVLE